MITVALELEDAVDEVLEDARPRHRAVLRDVADEDRRDPVLLRDAQQARGGLAHLRYRAGSRAELARVQRLHRVDDAHGRRVALERRADGLQLGLGEDRDVVGAAKPLRPKLHLCDRFLAGDEQRRPPAPRDRAECGEEQCRLADAGLAAEQDERGGHETAAQHAVELGYTRREPRRLLDANIAEALG